MLSACITPPPGIELAKGTEQDDIPVPERFEFRSSEAFDIGAPEEEKVRHWTGYYQGQGKYNDLLSWYIVKMKERGWTFKGLEGPRERQKLHFAKGKEQASIEIHRELDPQVGFTNVVCARIRHRGAEDYTLDENLDIVKGASIQPASYTPGETEGETGEDSGRGRSGKLDAGGGAEVPEAAGATETERGAEEPVLKEIEQFESSQ